MREDPLLTTQKDFGPFELREKIGSGGMGTVYLALQKSLKRMVVLKILHPHFADDDSIVTRFEREAHAAAQLKHPNICQVIDCSRYRGIPYIAMEFIEGEDLQKWFKAHPTPPVEVALLMLREVCRGLEHAHSHGVVHRDIKPANVMLGKDGSVKIMDFGLARVATDSIAMTAAGSVLGTPRYMSPEQATGEPVDVRTDVFSAGVMGFELLSGQCPFSGESYSAVIHSILYADPEPLQHFNPVVSGPCAAMIRKMLRKNADERYQSMTAALDALGEVRKAMDIPHGKDLLRDYAKDPEGTTRTLCERAIANHLRRAKESEARGPLGDDSALLEYMRVAHLDPSNAEAAARVNELRERGAKLRTEEPDPGDTAPLLSSVASLPPTLRTSMAHPAPPQAHPPAPTHGPPPSAPIQTVPGNKASGRRVAIGVLVAVAILGSFAFLPRLFPPGATVAVATTPPGAQLLLDGVAMPSPSPAMFRKVKGGSHVMRVTLEGYAPQERTFWIRPDGSATLSFDLVEARPKPAPQKEPQSGAAATTAATAPAAGPASLSVKTIPPGATISVDGTPLGRPSNNVYKDLQPGRHKVQISLSGYEDQERSVDLQAGATTGLKVDLSGHPTRFGFLQFKAEPGASVMIDGVEQQSRTFADPIRVGVGTRRVHISAPGGATMDKDFDVGENETHTVDYTAFLGAGSILLDTNVRLLGADVWVDGRDTGRKTPRLITGLSARNHTLKLVSTDYVMVGGDTVVAVVPGQRLDITLRMVKQR